MQYPPQRVCVVCQAKDRFKPYKLADKKATVMTFTQDSLALAIDPPTIYGTIDFEGGGRMVCEFTDCDPAEIKVGIAVEMTFRKLFTAGGIHNYFWKCKPSRG